MLAKAATATGCRLASAPPPTTTSHRPEATRRPAAAMAWVPAAHAVTMTSEGPCHPRRMEMPAAPALAIIMGTRRGETRRAPRSLYTPTCSARVSNPPTPVAKMTPGPGRAGVDGTGVLHRQVGRGDAELGEPVDLAHLFGAEPPFGLEVGHRAPDHVGVEQAVPQGVHADAATGDRPQPGDGHPPAPDRAVGTVPSCIRAWRRSGRRPVRWWSRPPARSPRP